MIHVAYVSNSNRLELRGLRDHMESYVNDATVEATCVDSIGDEITGETWPKSMPYVSGGLLDEYGNTITYGCYAAVLAADIGISAGETITAKITATSGSVTAYWELPVKVETRDE